MVDIQFIPRSCLKLRVNAEVKKPTARSYRLINQLVNTSCIPSRTIRDMKSGNVVVVHLQSSNRQVLLQIALVLPRTSSTISRDRVGASTKTPPAFQEGITRIGVDELFKD